MEHQMSRVVLVTGGNRGIGLACTQRFLKEGDRVAITYSKTPPDFRDDNLLAIKCDVTKADEVEALFKQVEDTWGNVEVLVANAGITRDGLLMRMSEEQWDDVLDTNLKAAWRCAKRASKGMLRGGGRMIFMSSVVALFGGPGQANYGASKAGLIGLARSITRELGAKGITANVVAPGPVATDMLDALGEEGAAKLTELVPLKRAASPEEVAAAVTFLASPEAAYISGVVLPVDGGMGMGN
jgi:NAD(P)-dependent dehydrogenase (short-subunit alcohol dehydrogenase family)